MPKSFLPRDPPLAADSRPRRYRVHVDAPTPLAANPLEVEAATEAEAWQAFCRVNGIGGTERPVSITPVENDNAD